MRVCKGVFFLFLLVSRSRMRFKGWWDKWDGRLSIDPDGVVSDKNSTDLRCVMAESDFLVPSKILDISVFSM